MKRTLLRLASAAAAVLPLWLKTLLYRLGPLAQITRRALNWAAPGGLQEVRIAAGALKGHRLWADLQREKDLWLGTYEPALQQALGEHLRVGMVVYDVGANVGYLTLLMAFLVGEAGRVFAFEPLPANLERLERNVALNGYGRRTVVVPKAVGDKLGKAQFWVHISPGMGKVEGSAGREVAYAESIEVEMVSLDAFVYDQGHPEPGLVKLDVEGGEVLALPGMLRLLTEARPVLMLELHGEGAAGRAWEVLEQAGYSVHRMAPGTPPVRGRGELDWKAYVIAYPAEREPPVNSVR